MEKAYKKFSAWVGMLVNTCISLLKIFLRLSSAVKMPMATENSCVVLGNGPSLKQSMAKYADVLKKHQLDQLAPLKSFIYSNNKAAPEVKEEDKRQSTNLFRSADLK